MTRDKILTEAYSCVCKDRDQQYGSPENNFAIIASFWNDYLSAKQYFSGFCFELTPDDVGIMMALLKIARIASGQTKADNYIDLAGYAACAGEIALKND